MDDKGKLLTLDQITETYGVPKGYLYSWIKRQKLHCVKSGTRSVLVYEKSFLKFLADHEVRPKKRDRVKHG
jgi:excisionase family DNA binding protein